jgi:MFS family permease
MADAAVAAGAQPTTRRDIQKIIAASSLGTMIEWYDFYIFGSLATVISGKFYHTGTALGDLIAWLATFAIGFLVRPFGAIVFGRLGDIVGRKYTFLVTMSLMGLCTFAVGLLPDQTVLGIWAGILLITLRIIQGLALGGEYGGAATYIAEHAPNGKRGYYTSFIQITATAGLFLSLGVILSTRQYLGTEAFTAWGWRIPFLVSIILVAISLYIRYSMRESPLYSKLKASGGLSKNPIIESFGNPENLRWVLLALFGATMGQGVVWYTGQFYALFYLQTVFHVNLVDSNLVVAGALLVACPLFVVFGSLSDRIGRKPIMMTGMGLALLTWYPLYGLMAAYAPATYTKAAVAATATTAAVAAVPGVKVVFQQFLFPYVGYNPWVLFVCVFVQVVWVTMVYGPIAAFLVEMFPTKIRYTSMSLPYHIGNGVFGGLVPIIGLSLLNNTKNNYAGLWYPMGVTAVCLAVGSVFVKESSHIDLNAGESMAGPGAPMEQVEPDEI